MVFPKRRLALFIHGCFWHRHPGCSKASTPKSNTAYWCAKFEQNTIRDAAAVLALTSLGWRVSTIWECETKDPNILLDRLIGILTSGEHDEEKSL
jgi:DNA mismatch endonuclease (patch repair protein)